MLGFTRVEPPEEGVGDEAAARASLEKGAPDWISASEVHGEGIFIRFDEKEINAWEEKDAVKA